MEKNNSAKILIMIAVIIYILSPVDMVPGPIDDFIIALMAYCLNRQHKKSND